MANAISLSVNTWTTQHMAEVFLKPVFTAENIVDTYGIDPTVNRSKTISLATELSRIVQKKDTCAFNPQGSFSLGEKTIRTEPCAINIEQCAAEFYDAVFKQNLKRGTDIYDLSGTVIEEVMVDNITRALTNDVFDLCWFGDTTNTGFFDTFDGWFKLIDAAAGVTKTTTAAGALSADDAIGYLKDAYSASSPLRSVKPTEKVFLVTDSIYLNLMETYEAMGIDSGMARLQEGGPLTFRGIPVEAQLNWDSTIAAESLTNPNRIVYTKKENMIIGTDIKNPGSDAKLFLDELTEKFYFKANFDLGVQYLFDEYVVYGS